MKRHQPASIDKDTQNARLQSSAQDSLTWSVISDPLPRYGNVSRHDNKVFNVIQSSDNNSGGTQTPNLTTSTSVPTFLGANFTFAGLIPQNASWAAVFDQYRIMAIEAWIRPLSGTSGTVDSNGANMLSVIDYDDANTPTQVSALLAYENVMIAPMTNGHYRKFRPHIAVSAYNGSFSGFQNSKSGWIDVASNTVQHYGIKLAVEPTSVAYKVYISYRVWIQFRNVF